MFEAIFGLFGLIISLFVPIIMLLVLYWVVRLGVRHGMRDYLRRT